MATNEYGAKLDKNGYATSLLATNTGVCYLCGRQTDTARHEPFGGAFRAKSKRLGLWVNLCPDCHQNAPWAAHKAKETEDSLCRLVQGAAMRKYGWTRIEFIAQFGRNYMED